MRIKPGFFYSVDPDNTVKQDTTGLAAVEAIEKAGYNKNGVVWKVRPLEDVDKTIMVNACRLKPINQPIIRIPADVPYVNDNDINIINDILSKADEFNLSKDQKIRLESLLQKLSLFKSIREV